MDPLSYAEFIDYQFEDREIPGSVMVSPIPTVEIPHGSTIYPTTLQDLYYSVYGKKLPAFPPDDESGRMMNTKERIYFANFLIYKLLPSAGINDLASEVLHVCNVVEIQDDPVVSTKWIGSNGMIIDSLAAEKDLGSVCIPDIWELPIRYRLRYFAGEFIELGNTECNGYVYVDEQIASKIFRSRFSFMLPPVLLVSHRIMSIDGERMLIPFVEQTFRSDTKLEIIDNASREILRRARYAHAKAHSVRNSHRTQ